jgi:hypothetical protein
LAPHIIGFFARRRLELSMRRLELDELRTLLPGVMIALDVLQELDLVELPVDLPSSTPISSSVKTLFFNDLRCPRFAPDRRE